MLYDNFLNFIKFQKIINKSTGFVGLYRSLLNRVWVHNAPKFGLRDKIVLKTLSNDNICHYP